MDLYADAIGLTRLRGFAWEPYITKLQILCAARRFQAAWLRWRAFAHSRKPYGPPMNADKRG
jgi:hypothetical protein